MVPDWALREETEGLARTLAERAPLALRLVKEAVRAAEELPMSEGLARERELFLESFASADGREGVAAFLEKRPPRFTGR